MRDRDWPTRLGGQACRRERYRSSNPSPLRREVPMGPDAEVSDEASRKYGMRLRRDSEDGQPAAPDQCSHSDVASRAPLPAAPGHQVIHSIEWRPRHLMTEVSQAG